MMHETSRWPETYGFHISGDGPAYVIQVDRGGVAMAAGLNPGDMLLEVDGHSVTDMSAESIKILARHSRSVPPTLGVVSRVKVVDLTSNRRWGYGFRVSGRLPVIVGSVDPPGPAYQAGLRPGDIILKVNGVDVIHEAMVTSVLQAHAGRMALSVIPVEAPGVLPDLGVWQAGGVRDGTETGHEPAGPARRAKDLCHKMDDVLGESYDKKMAAIGLLKRYAEDRDIDSLVDSLYNLLRTEKERSLVPVLRALVPVQHKSSFDSLIVPLESEVQYDPSVSKHSSTTVGDASNGRYSTESRFLKVRRGKGSFGFILRGHDPVTVETTVPAGPADRSGILPGDAIIGLNGLDVRNSSHAKMVDLLRGSGTAPILEILRVEKNSSLSLDNTDSVLYTSDTDSIDKHPDSFNTDENSSMDLKGGENLSDYVHLLLTEREALEAVRALQEYKRNGRIGDLMVAMRRILDSPPKRTLWYHIVPRLPPHHQTQVSQAAANLLLDPDELHKHVKSHHQPNRTQPADDTPDTDVSIGSFKKQLDYLLTSPERTQLKRSLEEYIHTKDVHSLIQSLQQLLDTPSKRTLFFYVIPLLNPTHQGVCQRVLGLPRHYTEQGRGQHHSPHHNRDADNWQLQPDGRPLHTVLSEESEKESSLSSEDREDSFSQRDTLPLREASTPGFILGARNLRPGPTETHTKAYSAQTPLGQGAKPKRKVKMVRESAAQTTPRDSPVRTPIANYKTIIQVLESPGWSSQQQESMPMADHGKLHGLNFSKPNQNHSEDAFLSPGKTTHSHPWSQARAQSSPQLLRSAKPVYNMNRTSTSQSYHSPNPTSHNEYLLQSIHDIGSPQKNNNNNSARVESYVSSEPSKLAHWHPNQRNSNGLSSEGDNSRTSDDQSLDSFQRNALNALQVLDDVVDNEPLLPTSHIDNFLEPFEHVSTSVKRVGFQQPGGEGWNQASHIKVIPPSPPPPPPIPIPPPPPPPPAPPLPAEKSREKAGTPSTVTDSIKMNVKRINWEKIDDISEDTIWAKLNTGEDLKDMVKHLHLEKQFTTKRSKIADTFHDRKTEVGILSPKKAYNISILLGHMKIPVYDVKDALLAVDDIILTSDILRHLLAFAPDENEMDRYDSYSGNTEDLSKPDQFMYQITRVPNFQARLRAMLFKASFHDKVDEIKKRLDNLQKASNELMESKSLAKLLELVLAMGNQMNKGDTRVGSAAGFRVTYLTQLDMMKTSTGQSNFLNVLAEVVHGRFPSAIKVLSELPTLSVATRDAEINPNEEISEVKKVLQETKEAINDISEKDSQDADKLHSVMKTFITQATADISNLGKVQDDTSDVCRQMIKYFGEDPEKTSLVDTFSTFAKFIYKLERAYQQNLATKKT